MRQEYYAEVFYLGLFSQRLIILHKSLAVPHSGDEACLFPFLDNCSGLVCFRARVHGDMRATEVIVRAVEDMKMKWPWLRWSDIVRRMMRKEWGREKWEGLYKTSIPA